jgi:hypothetical protein
MKNIFKSFLRFKKLFVYITCLNTGWFSRPQLWLHFTLAKFHKFHKFYSQSYWLHHKFLTPSFFTFERKGENFFQVYHMLAASKTLFIDCWLSNIKILCRVESYRCSQSIAFDSFILLVRNWNRNLHNRWQLYKLSQFSCSLYVLQNVANNLLVISSLEMMRWTIYCTRFEKIK